MSRIVGATALALLSSLAACDPSPGYEFNDRAPTAIDDSASTRRDTSVYVDLLGNDYDADGDTLRVAWVRADGHTAATAPGGAYITPAPGFTGTIEATYGVSDGLHESLGHIRVYVTETTNPGTDGGPSPDAQPWPDAQSNVTPTALSFTAPQIPLNGRSSIRLQGTDPDSTELTYVIVSQPQYGTVTGNGTAEVVYQPQSGFSGYDSFQYTVSDGNSTSEPGVVHVYITEVSDPPMPLPAMVRLREDEPATVTLQATDTGSTAHTFEVVSAPGSGRVTISGRDATYTPNANYSGTDSFTFRVRNGWRVSETTATVTLTIDQVDDAPIGDPQTVRLAEDSSAAIRLTGSDVERDIVTFEIASQPAHGGLTGTPPAMTYTPAANYAGSDQFTFVAIAGGQRSAPALVRLDVTPVNDAPVAQATRVATPEDTLVAIPLTATDIDTTPLTYTIVGAPTMGTATLAANVVSYTPAANRSGTDQLTFEVFDGTSRSRAVVDIQVTPVNDVPTAADDLAVTAPGQRVVIAVASNDSDVDSAAFAVSDAGRPASGTAAVTDDGQIAYSPADGFVGTDTFTYTLSDSDGGTATATVRVGVGQFPVGVPAEVVGITGETDLTRAYSLSADGRLVVFTSVQRLVDTDTNDLRDVYLFDRATRRLDRISTTATGGDPDAHSGWARISGDGSRIVYESDATNLVAGDSNRVTDIFVHDRGDGSTRLVSVDSDERASIAGCYLPVISDDGNLVAFVSRAFNLVAGDGNGAFDVFVRNLRDGTTERVSVSHKGREANLGSIEVALSGDGRVVAFSSQATNLVATPTTGRHVFVRDLARRTTEVVSINTASALADQDALTPSLSRDGRYVAFTTTATNLAAGTAVRLQRSYVRDRQERHTLLGTPVDVLATSTSLSADGRYLVVSTTRSTVTGVAYLRDRFAALSSQLTGAGTSAPAISADGRYVLWANARQNLVAIPNPR